MHNPHKVRRECIACVEEYRVCGYSHVAALVGGQLESRKSLSCPSNQRLDQESGQCALISNIGLKKEQYFDDIRNGKSSHPQSKGGTIWPETLQTGPLSSQQARSKSIDKTEKIGIGQTTSTQVLAYEQDYSKRLENEDNFLEYENFPPIRTRVLTSSSDRTKVIEEKRDDKRSIQRNLTDLLDEVNNSYERVETAEEDEEFNFEKEAEKCQEQLSLFSDAYVLDMSECNLESDSRIVSSK